MDYFSEWRINGYDRKINDTGYDTQAWIWFGNGLGWNGEYGTLLYTIPYHPYL